MDSTTTDSDRISRRTVPKTTAAAAGTGVVEAGTVSASFTEGQCVVVAGSLGEAHDEPCPFDEPTVPPYQGAEGTIVETCTASDSTYGADVDWNSHPTTWVETSELDYC